MREKLIRQHNIKDCGPASLASIISYYKGYISVDALSYMMHTSQSGTTAYDLIEVAKKIGFAAIGKKTSNLSDIKLPCICHVLMNHTYHHYVVLYRVDNKKKQVLIADPASGFKYYSFESFYEI